MSEFRIRALVRRIDAAELELRELLVRVGSDPFFDKDDKRARRTRRRVLRRWLAEDRARLGELLGAKPVPPGRDKK